MLALSHASKNRTLPGGRDGCSPHRMLLQKLHYQVFGRGCSTDACSPHRMLLGTGRDQVGSVGDTGRYPDVEGWMLALSHASKNRTLPGWPRWMLAPSDASTETGLPGFGRGCSTDGCSPHRMRLGTGRYQEVGNDGCWQGWLLAALSDVNRTLRLAAMAARPIGATNWTLPGLGDARPTAARPIGCFYKPDVTRLAGMDARPISPHPMRLETGRDQVCAPQRKILGTGRYQVGRDRCSPHRVDRMNARYQVGSNGCF